MDKKLVELYENFCKVNDEIIKTRDSISPMCFMIGRDYSVNLISVLFSGQKEKELFRSRLKDFLINSDISGYVLIFDTKVTMFDKKHKNKQPIVKDCVVRTLYTPKGNKVEFVFYENNKITKKQALNDKEASEMRDEWDVFNIPERKENLDEGHIQKLIEFNKTRVGEKHHRWGGKKISKLGLHKYLRRYNKAPKVCDFCKKKKKLDLASKDGTYNFGDRNINNFYWLCRSCHTDLDNSLGLKEKDKKTGRFKKPEIDFDYQKFKMENKKLYDGIVKPFEDYHRIENKEGNLIFAYHFNHQEKRIKYYITDEFRQNGEAMKVFNLMKLSGFKIIEVDENEDEVKNG